MNERTKEDTVFQHAKEYQKDNRDISVEIHKLLFENY